MTVAEFIYTVLLKPPLLKRSANLILRFILPKSIKIKGATIYLNPADPVVSGALTFRVYENDEIDFFLRWFESDMTFVDIGANVGLYTGLALSRCSGRANILSIEPHSESAKYLNQTIRSNRSAERHANITIRNIAASDSKGSAVLYKNSQNIGDNRIYPDPLCDECESIDADTLDNICEQAGFESVNYIKVDVQGAEFKVFSGASRILSRSPDCIIMTEFWPYGLTQCGSSPEQYLAMLQELGFTLYELSGKTLAKIESFQEIISRSPRRVYRNLIGLKGKFILVENGTKVNKA